MKFPEYITIIKDIVTIIGAFFAAFIAWQGLSTWRRQLRGNSRYELARRLLLSAYKLRDAVQEMRSPGMHGAEMSNAMKEIGWSMDGLDDAKRISVGMQAVYGVRWRKVQEAKRELHVNSLEGKVLWGEEPDAAYREITACTQKLWAEITVYIEFKDSGIVEDYQERIRRMKIMHPMGTPDEDEFMASLDAGIARFEKLARPYLMVGH
jgi:hypothetical protein